MRYFLVRCQIKVHYLKLYIWINTFLKWDKPNNATTNSLSNLLIIVMFVLKFFHIYDVTSWRMKSLRPIKGIVQTKMKNVISYSPFLFMLIQTRNIFGHIQNKCKDLTVLVPSVRTNLIGSHSSNKHV